MAFNPYPGRTEPDMRQELVNTLHGKYPEMAKKIRILQRKMRRTDAGNLIDCECVDAVTHEPDKDTFCPICHGEGYKWDEIFVDVYKVVIRSNVGNATNEHTFEPGTLSVPIAIFYAEAKDDFTNDDKLVELALDKEGNIVKPYIRKQLFRIVTAVDLRAENGRLEFWKLDCYQEKRKFLNG